MKENYVLFVDGHKEDILEIQDKDDYDLFVRTESGWYRKVRSLTRPMLMKLNVRCDGVTSWRNAGDEVQNIHVVKRIPMPFSIHIQDVTIKGTIQAKQGDQYRQVLLDIAQCFNGDLSIPCEMEVYSEE